MTWAGERHADTSREASTTVATCPTPSRRSKSFLYRVFPMFPLRRSRRLVLPREPRAPRARVRERRAKRARTPHLATSLPPRRTHVCLPPRRTHVCLGSRRTQGLRALGARLLQVLLACQVFLPHVLLPHVLLPCQVFLPPLPPVPPVVSPPSSSTGYVCIHARTYLVIFRILLLPLASSTLPRRFLDALLPPPALVASPRCSRVWAGQGRERVRDEKLRERAWAER
jgi:hypothetical protein